jgi:hypothetical protein
MGVKNPTPQEHYTYCLTRVGILHCLEDKTWEGRQGHKGGKPDKKGMIGHKITHKSSILWIKSSLFTIPPCLPGLAFTENIKNLHLSDTYCGVGILPAHVIFNYAYLLRIRYC